MEGYNPLSYFRGVPRQRGRGFEALARTVARTTLGILKRHFSPVTQKIDEISDNRVSKSRNGVFISKQISI